MRALESLKKKYALLGQAAANKNMIDFLGRLQDGLNQEKESKTQEKTEVPVVASESQYKHPTGRHLRSQSAFPSSINKSRSFGGRKDQTLRERLDAAIDAIDEDVAVQKEGGVLMADRGQFFVDGELAIGNHADILKLLVVWMAENAPEVMKSAVDDMANMVRNGAQLR